MYKLMQGDPDTVIRWYRVLLLVAMSLGYLCANLDLPGLVTLIFLGSLGAAGGSLVQYKTERGLWMHSAFFFLIYTSIYAMFIVSEIGDFLRNAGQLQLIDAADFTVATALLSANIRFLYRTGLLNWTTTHQVPLD